MCLSPSRCSEADLRHLMQPASRNDRAMLSDESRRTRGHIGLDLDNTLIDYDRVFGRVGAALGVVPESMSGLDKAEVRGYLRAQSAGEIAWMRLQGQVYGRYLGNASLHVGVAEFLRRLKALGVQVSIVSHKTRYGHFDPAQVDLWDATMVWLENQGFFADDQFGIPRQHVFFEQTRGEKLIRIANLGCDLFIDDLPEVLLDPAFPAATERLWFANGQAPSACPGLQAFNSWYDLAAACETRLSSIAKDA
jgi:hypothetical protein